MIVLLVVGAVLQATGLALAGFGFRATWREHARGQDFWEPYKRRVKSALQRIENRVRRLVGRPRTVTVQAHSAIHLVGSGTGYATEIWSKPPDPKYDLDGFAETVHDRLNRLYAMIQKDQHDLAIEREARQKADNEIRAALDTEAEQLRTFAQHVAVGGLHLELVGWLLLFVGLVLSSIGSIELSL